MKSYLLIIFFFFILFEVPLGFNVNLAPGLSPKNLMLYILLVWIALEHSASRSGIRLSPASLNLCFLALIIATMFSWAISVVGYKSIDYPLVRGFVELKSSSVDHYVIMLVFAFSLAEKEDVLKVAKWVSGIVVFSSIFTVVELTDILPLGLIDEGIDGRVKGPIGQPNQYGGFLAFWFPVCAAAYFASRGMTRNYFAVGTLLALGLLILSGSRGALLGSVAGAVLAVVYLRRVLPGQVVIKGTFATVLIGAVVVAVIMLQFSEVIEARIERTTSGGTKQVTAGRGEIWGKAIHEMIDNPASFLYGNGWMTFRLLLDKGAHNMYLEKLFELGVIGLSIWLALLASLLSLLRSALRVAARDSAPYLYGAVFGVFAIIVSTFFSELYRPWMLIWSYLGVAVKLALIELEGRATQASAIVASRGSLAGSERVSG
ncbi:MAG: O-antigen ligase family protein [Pseudomonadota bacterium]